MAEELKLEEIEEKLKIFAEIFVTFWEKHINKAIEIYIKNFSSLIDKRPDFNSLKKYWGAEWRDELRSFVAEIAAEHYSECKKWLNNPKFETYPRLMVIISQKIEEIISTGKEKNKYEWLGGETKRPL